MWCATAGFPRPATSRRDRATSAPGLGRICTATQVPRRRDVRGDQLHVPHRTSAARHGRPQVVRLSGIAVIVPLRRRCHSHPQWRRRGRCQARGRDGQDRAKPAESVGDVERPPSRIPRREWPSAIAPRPMVRPDSSLSPGADVVGAGRVLAQMWQKGPAPALPRGLVRPCARASCSSSPHCALRSCLVGFGLRAPLDLCARGCGRRAAMRPSAARLLVEEARLAGCDPFLPTRPRGSLTKWECA